VLEAVKEKVGNTFLVLHGGSGTPEDDIKKAIQLGVVKININTEKTKGKILFDIFLLLVI
jgi:fructose-bisphosphate aldolase class II